MGNLWYWLLAAVSFGLISGALYTWISPRKLKGMKLFLRSSGLYFLFAMAIVLILLILT